MSSMGVNDPQAAAKVSGCLKELFKLIKSTDEARRATEPTLSSISATHRKIQADQKLTPAVKNKLKSLYEDAAREASKEEELLRKSLDKIYQIRQVRDENTGCFGQADALVVVKYSTAPVHCTPFFF